MPRWPWSRPTSSDLDEDWNKVIVPRVQAAKVERLRLLVGQEDRVAQLEDLLFALDPVGLNFDTNTDEYRSEAETITVRLPEATSEAELLRIIHEEFCQWFGKVTAGPISRYEATAAAMWHLLQQTPDV